MSKNLNGRRLDVDFGVEIGKLVAILEDGALQVEGAFIADDLALIIGKKRWLLINTDPRT